MKKQIILLTSAFLLLTYCFSSAQELSEPEKNFDHLWKTFDREYGIFLPKRVDWNALYKVYRPKVTPQTTDDKLFDIMASMLGHLNDNHVRLSNNTRQFGAGFLQDFINQRFGSFEEAMQLMRKKPVDEKYIKGTYKELMDGMFSYGWVTDDIGYFHFRGFRDVTGSANAVDEILKEFRNAKGMIIDVRRNGGGNDMVGKAIADRFADKKRLYMMTQIRNGENHDDFAAAKYFYAEPGGPVQFTKPIVLLQDRTSISAAENFSLAMRVLPHATLVGDFTSGCFADAKGGQLPNGWRYSISYTLFVDQNGFCWEGIGVPSDLRIQNKDEDAAQGKDRLLEFAIDLIKTDSIKLKDKKYKYPIE